MSERQLVEAFKQRNLRVSLEQIRQWRIDGLLPPLSHHGAGRGRTFYWTEDDIVTRAQCVYDAVRRYHRLDVVLRMIWSAGFPVPTKPLRRAWLAYLRSEADRPASVRSPRKGQGVAGALMPVVDLADALQAMCLTMAAQGSARRPKDINTIIAILNRAAILLGGRAAGDAQAWWLVFEALVRSAPFAKTIENLTDEEFDLARLQLQKVSQFLEACGLEAGISEKWNFWFFEHLAVQALAVILTLRHGSARSNLDKLLALIGSAGAPSRRLERHDQQLSLQN